MEFTTLLAPLIEIPLPVIEDVSTNVEFVILVLVALLSIIEEVLVVVLLKKVELVRANDGPLARYTAPPTFAELAEKVELLIVIPEVAAETAPPLKNAEFPEKVELLIVSVELCAYMAPPYCPASLLVNVELLIIAFVVAPICRADPLSVEVLFENVELLITRLPMESMLMAG